MKKVLAVAMLCIVNVFFSVAQAQAPKPCGSVDQNLTSLLETVVSHLPPQAGETPAAISQGLLANLRAVPGGCTALKAVGGEADKIQLHVAFESSGQVLFVVYKGTINPARILRASIGRVLGPQFAVQNPVFTLSRTDVTFDKDKLPSQLQTVIDQSMLGLSTFSVKGGFQIAAGVTLDGAMRWLVQTAFGATGPFMMRAGLVYEGLGAVGIPDPSGGAAGAGGLGLDTYKKYKDYKEGKTDPEPPELFVEITPQGPVRGPFGQGVATLTDSTFLITSKFTAGYKGNITFPAIGKKFVAFMEYPFAKEPKLDFMEVKFGLAAPELSLKDFAYLNAAFASMGGTAFLPQPLVNALNTMATPLTAFVVTNPVPVPVYTLGKDFPAANTFNVLVLGPTASLGEDNGPRVRLYGNARVLGQAMGKIAADLSPAGLQSTASSNLNLNLGPLGTQGVGMTAHTNITNSAQVATLSGNVAGRSINFGLNGNTVSMSSPATCLTPVSLSGSANISSSLNLTAIAITGVNVDPLQIAGCTGEALKAAYHWIGNQGAKLGGYSVAAANAALNALENPGQTLEQVGNLFKAGTWDSWHKTRKHPPRTAYDCTNLDPKAGPEAQKFVDAYPPGRIWGSREDYDNRSMNFARYIFSPVDNKFHPLMNSTVLGATQCGGLVAEEGHGYGRMNAPDKEIFDRALMCERGKFPKHLVGEPIHNASECYKWRGLQTAPRPDLWGRLVQVNGRPEWNIITQNGHLRPILANNTCGPPGAEIIRLSSLHYLYEMPLDLPPFNAEQCAASRPRTDAQKAQDELNQRMAQNVQQNVQNTAAQMQSQLEHAQQAFINSNKGRFFFVCGDRDKHTWLVGHDGQRHYVSGARNWNNWNACNPPKEGPTCVDLATLNRFPKGTDITSGANCISLR